MSGSKFSTSRGTVIYVGDFLRSSGRTRCATSSRSPGRRTRTPTSPGTSSSAAPTSSWPTSGATWSTGRSRWRTRTSGRSRSRSRPPTPTPSCWRLRAGFDTVGELLGAQPVQAGGRGGDAGGDRGQPVPVRPGAVEAQGRPRAARHDPAHRAAGGAGREHVAHAVPAARGAAGARGVGRHRGVGGAAGDQGGRRPRRRPRLPRAHRRLRRRAGAVGVHAGGGRPPAGPADADLHQARPGARRDRPEWAPIAR